MSYLVHCVSIDKGLHWVKIGYVLLMEGIMSFSEVSLVSALVSNIVAFFLLPKGSKKVEIATEIQALDGLKRRVIWEDPESNWAEVEYYY